MIKYLPKYSVPNKSLPQAFTTSSSGGVSGSGTNSYGRFNVLNNTFKALNRAVSQGVGQSGGGNSQP